VLAVSHGIFATMASVATVSAPHTNAITACGVTSSGCIARPDVISHKGTVEIVTSVVTIAAIFTAGKSIPHCQWAVQGRPLYAARTKKGSTPCNAEQEEGARKKEEDCIKKKRARENTARLASALDGEEGG
jgi:hypothetical protein